MISSNDIFFNLTFNFTPNFPGWNARYDYPLLSSRILHNLRRLYSPIYREHTRFSLGKRIYNERSEDTGSFMRSNERYTYRY